MQRHPSTPPNTDSLCIRIRQQNTNKSLVAQIDMLHRLDPKLFDIAAIQEPYLDFNHNTHANHHWYTIYPREHFVEPKKTGSVMLIGKHMPTDSWSQVDFSSSDITAVQVQMRRGPTLIINMYNDNKNSDSICKVGLFMSSYDRTNCLSGPRPHLLWLGNFNSHHPLWDEPRNLHHFTRNNLDRAQEVINLIANYDMQMALHKGTPTLQAMSTGNLARTDNIFVSHKLANMVTECRTIPEEQPARCNYRAADWQAIREELAIALAGVEAKEELDNVDEFYALLHTLTRKIQDTLEKTILKTKPSPFTKQWWSRELSQHRDDVRRLA